MKVARSYVLEKDSRLRWARCGDVTQVGYFRTICLHRGTLVRLRAGTASSHFRTEREGAANRPADDPRRWSSFSSWA